MATDLWSKKNDPRLPGRSVPNLGLQLSLAIVAIALAPRIVLILLYPEAIGDAKVYLTVARNIYLNGCVSLSDPSAGACVPHWGGNNLPGYPAFVAVVAAFTRESLGAVRVLQAAITSLAVVYLAQAVCALTGSRRAAFAVGLLLALSPSAIGWPRHIFTESLAIAATSWILAEIAFSLAERRLRTVRLGLALATIAFIRVDLLALALPIALATFLLHTPRTAVRQGIAIAVIAALPLAAWSARSAAVGLSPYPNLYTMPNGGPTPDGLFAWGTTWSEHEYDMALWAFPAFTMTYDKIVVPDKAFRSEDERLAVEALLSDLAVYRGQPIPAAIDRAFGQLAATRRSDAPVEHYVWLPLRRAGLMWINVLSSTGLPSAAEEGTVDIRAELRQHMENGVGGLLQFASEYPELVIFKGVSAAHRILLLLALPILIVSAIRARTVPGVSVFIWITVLFSVVRILTFVFGFSVSTRYLVEPIVGLEVAFVMAVWSLARRRSR